MKTGILVGGLAFISPFNAWSADALKVETQSDAKGISMTLTVDWTQVSYESQNGGSLHLPGFFTFPEQGRWALPQRVIRLAVPAGVVITRWTMQTEGRFLDHLAMPLTRVPFEHPELTTDNQPLPDRYPVEVFQFETIQVKRGFPVLAGQIHPVQIETSSGKLWAISKYVVRIEWAASGEAPAALRPPVDHPSIAVTRREMESLVVNVKDVPGFQPKKPPMRAGALGLPAATYQPRLPGQEIFVEGVIICAEAMKEAFQPLAHEKTRAGHVWDVVTYEWIYAQAAYRQNTFGDEAAAIRTFLQEAYQQYGLEYVFFGGVPPMIFGGYSMDPGMTRGLGYYTNLDGGHHEMAWAQTTNTTRWVSLNFVTLRGGEVVPEITGYNTYTTETPTAVTFKRCEVVRGSLSLAPRVLNPFFVGSPDDVYFSQAYYAQWLFQHPEAAGQTFWCARWEQFAISPTCDTEPELTAGVLELPRGGDALTVATYLSKLRRYREPVAPERMNRVLARPWNLSYNFDPNQDQMKSSDLAPDFAAAGLSQVGFFDSTGGRGTSVLKGGVSVWFHNECNSFNDPYWRPLGSAGLRELDDPAWAQPSGLFVHMGGRNFSSYIYGSDDSSLWRDIWEQPYTGFFFHPSGGPVAALYGGFTGCGRGNQSKIWNFNGVRPLLASLARDHVPLGRLIRGYSSDGHDAIYLGDPTIAMWTAPPTRLQVVHPGLATGAFSVNVHHAGGQPVPGAVVTVSKRLPDGSYVVYLRQTTDVGGQASFTLPVTPAQLGSGALSVEVASFTIPGFQDYYPYHGVMALPSGNQPPVINVSFPTEIPLTTPEGSWIQLDASSIYDPDGDPVSVQWNQGLVQIMSPETDGQPMPLTRDDRVVKFFLKPGPSVIQMVVSDGVSITIKRLTLNVIAGLDRTPPTVSTPALVVPPTNQWMSVSVLVVAPTVPTLAGALEFRVQDPVDPMAPTAPRGIASWRMLSVTSTDPNRPQSVTCRIVGTTLELLAEANADFTVRRYAVTVEVVDVSGNKTVGKGDVVISPTSMDRVKGWVYEERFPYGAAGAMAGYELKRRPVEAPVLMEVIDPATSWRTRLVVGSSGIYDEFIPGFGHYWQAPRFPVRVVISKGGRRYRQMVGGSNGVYPGTWPPQGFATFYSADLNGAQFFGRLTTDMAIVPANRPPVAAVPSPMVTASGTGPTDVWLDGRPSSDPDQDLLIYTWTWIANGVPHTYHGPLVKAPFPAGTTQVTLTVSDLALSASTLLTVQVESGGSGPTE